MAPLISFAQDPYFTQPLGSPMYYNPAFAGIQQNLRASFQYRNQWEVGNGYAATMATCELGSPKINSGFGLTLMNSVSGLGVLSKNTVGLNYAYDLKLTENAHLRMGLGASLFQKLFDNTLGLYDSTSVRFAAQKLSTNYIPDFSVGLLYYNQNAYIGLGIAHLTQPNESFDGSNTDIERRRYSLQAGTFFNSGSLIFSPNILIMTQGNTNTGTTTQVMPGINMTAGFFTLGTSLRLSNPNVNSWNFLLGVSFRKLRISYSYDLNISDNPGAFAGSHEFSIIFQLSTPHNTESVPIIKKLMNTI